MPPRHGKSELVSKHLPAWFLSAFPDRRVILASYEATFARSWGRKARAVFEAISSLSGQRISGDQSAAADWETTAGGGMVTAGVGGPITGRGADLLIIDDPVKNAEEALSETVRDGHWDWWQSTARTRLEPGGVTIVIATRWHHDDLSGRMLKAGEAGDMDIRRLRLPALADPGDMLGRAPGAPLWPERFPAGKLESIRRGMDAYWWSCLYQQSPSQDGRTLWPDGYFGSHLSAGAAWPDRFDISALALDPATGRDTRRGDFSALVFVGVAGGLLWIDAMLTREPPEAVIAHALDWCVDLRPDVLAVEVNGFQSLLAPEFHRQAAAKRFSPPPLVPLENRQAKELRIGRLGPYLEQRLIRLRDTHGCQMLQRQLREWPLAEHDDGPDALEMAIRAIAELQRQHAEGHETLEIIRP